MPALYWKCQCHTVSWNKTWGGGCFLHIVNELSPFSLTAIQEQNNTLLSLSLFYHCIIFSGRKWISPKDPDKGKVEDNRKKFRKNHFWVADENLTHCQNLKVTIIWSLFSGLWTVTLLGLLQLVVNKNKILISKCSSKGEDIVTKT